VLRRNRRWRQRYPDAERIQDPQSLSDFAGILAFFKVDDEPYPGSGGQSEVPLRDAQVFAGFPDQFSDLLGCVSQVRLLNVTVR